MGVRCWRWRRLPAPLVRLRPVTKAAGRGGAGTGRATAACCVSLRDCADGLQREVARRSLEQ